MHNFVLGSYQISIKCYALSRAIMVPDWPIKEETNVDCKNLGWIKERRFNGKIIERERK